MPTDVQTARTTDPNDPPPPTCPQHPNGTDEPCSGCRRARQTRKRYDAQRLDAEQGAARAQAEATSRAAHEHANLQAAEIAACDLCDENGYRHTPDGTSSAPCRHNPDDLERNAAAAKAAKAALRADLERKALGENPDTPANHTQPDRG